ncbi:MAG: DUF2950 domain-containing protein, partial [Nitrospiraceae bacterium]
MNRAVSNRKGEGRWLAMPVLIIAAAIFILGASSTLFAASTLHKSFSSPEEAVKALVDAVRAS